MQRTRQAAEEAEEEAEEAAHRPAWEVVAVVAAHQPAREEAAVAMTAVHQPAREMVAVAMTEMTTLQTAWAARGPIPIAAFLLSSATHRQSFAAPDSPSKYSPRLSPEVLPKSPQTMAVLRATWVVEAAEAAEVVEVVEAAMRRQAQRQTLRTDLFAPLPPVQPVLARLL